MTTARGTRIVFGPHRADMEGVREAQDRRKRACVIMNGDINRLSSSSASTTLPTSPPPHNRSFSGGVLILRGGAIGDFILTLPALRALRTTWPRARIVLAAYPRNARLALAAGLADEIRSLDEPWLAALFSARPEPTQLAHPGRFSLAVNYLHDPDGIVERNLYHMGTERVLSISPMIRNEHAADHLIRPLRQLGIATPLPALPCLQLPADLLAAARADLSTKLGRRIVTLHPGSGSPRKNWPLERFIRLAQYIDTHTRCRPVLVFGEADEPLRAQAATAPPPLPVLVEPDLTRLAARLAASTCHVGNDSGITHLAAALGVPTVAIFGPTDPAIWGPRGDNSHIARPTESTPAAIETIPFDSVWTTIAQGLSLPPVNSRQKHPLVRTFSDEQASPANAPPTLARSAGLFGDYACNPNRFPGPCPAGGRTV